MKSARQVLAEMPELAAFRERLQSPDWPTPEECAASAHALAQDRAERQPELPLERAA